MKIIEILQHEEEGRSLSACPGRWRWDGPGPTSGQRRVVRAGRQQRAPAHASPDRRCPEPGGARTHPIRTRLDPRETRADGKQPAPIPKKPAPIVGLDANNAFLRPGSA